MRYLRSRRRDLIPQIDMDIELLGRFVAVVELGSLNKAAAKLNLSQPTLSRSISLLEERFSAELIRRSFRNWFRPSYPYAYATFRCAHD